MQCHLWWWGERNCHWEFASVIVWLWREVDKGWLCQLILETPYSETITTKESNWNRYTQAKSSPFTRERVTFFTVWRAWIEQWWWNQIGKLRIYSEMSHQLWKWISQQLLSMMPILLWIRLIRWVMDSAGNNFLNGYPVFRPEIDNFSHVACRYTDVDVFCNYNVNSFFNIIMFNIRSLRKSFAQFLAYFSYMFVLFSYILLTEIWLDNDSADTFVLPGFHKIDLCRNNYGGGDRLFVRDDISASVLSDFTLINDFIEILTVECLVNGVKFIVSLIYHSPTASHVINNMFVEHLSSLLSQLKTKHLPLIVGVT